MHFCLYGILNQIELDILDAIDHLLGAVPIISDWLKLLEATHSSLIHKVARLNKNELSSRITKSQQNLTEPINRVYQMNVSVIKRLLAYLSNYPVDSKEMNGMLLGVLNCCEYGQKFDVHVLSLG